MTKIGKGDIAVPKVANVEMMRTSATDCGIQSIPPPIATLARRTVQCYQVNDRGKTDSPMRGSWIQQCAT